MITRRVGKAMAQATDRHNSQRQQKLQVFHKAMQTMRTVELKAGESEVVFSGTIAGKTAEIFLLKVGNRTTLNLTVDGQTFKPLLLTEMSTENDYLTWNTSVRQQIYGKETEVDQRQPTNSQITNPKAINEKAKSHEVTPLEKGNFRVKSGESGNEYIVRLLPNEQGGMCSCAWGEYRKRSDGYRSGCSHVQAVITSLEEQRGRKVSAWSSKEDAKRQHRPIANIGNGVYLTLRLRKA